MIRELTMLVLSQEEGLNQTLKSLCEKTHSLKINLEFASLDTFASLRKTLSPELFLFNLTDKKEEALRTARELKTREPEAVILFTSTDSSPELILEAMRVGGLDFLKQPILANDFQNVVEHVRSELLTKTSLKSKEGRSSSRLITVFSSKGGIGTTTVACNLAVELAALKTKTALADLVFQRSGDVPIYLDLSPSYTITHVLGNIHRLDTSLLRGAMVNHRSGLSILTGPKTLGEADYIDRGQLSEILLLMKRMYDYNVVDGGCIFTDQAVAAMDLSDYVFLVVALDLVTVRNASQCLDVFKRLRYGPDKVKLIINRFDSKGRLQPEEIERVLKYHVTFYLPGDYLVAVKSANSGLPISEFSPKSKLAQSFQQLAKLIMKDFQGEPQPASSSVFKKLFTVSSKEEKQAAQAKEDAL